MARPYQQLKTGTMLGTALVVAGLAVAGPARGDAPVLNPVTDPAPGPISTATADPVLVMSSSARSATGWFDHLYDQAMAVWSHYHDQRLAALAAAGEALPAPSQSPPLAPSLLPPLGPITQVASLPGEVPEPLTDAEQVAQATGDVIIQGRPTGDGIEGIGDDDPTSAQPDLRPIFEAIADGNLALADARLERLETRFPRFVAPEDLTAALADLRVRTEVDAAIAAGDPARLLQLPQDYPEAFACPSPANIWRIADVIAKTDRVGELMPLYRGVVEECPDPADRFFAIERSLAELPLADTALLLEIERQRPPAETDVARLKAFDDRVAAQQFTQAFAAGRTRTASDAALRAAQPGPAIQLGYEALGRGQLNTAKRWFDRAIRWGGGVDARIGAANVALEAGAFARAEALINQIPVTDDRGVALRDRLLTAQFDQILADGDLVRAGEIATKSQNPTQATLLGWANLERDNLPAADRWFANALQWGGGDETLLGAITTALAQRDLASARDFLGQLPPGDTRRDALMVQLDLLMAQRLYDNGAPEQALITVREAQADAERLGDQALVQQARDQAVVIQLAEAQRIYDAGDYEAAKTRADAILAASATNNDELINAARLTGAWSRYQLGEFRSAANRFEPLLQTDLQETAAEGLALSLAATDQVERLIETANKVDEPVAETMREVGRERALQRGHVQTAAMIAAPGETPEGLSGIGDPWVQAGVSLRFSDGEAGQDRFSEASPSLAVGIPIGRHRVAAIVRAPIIDIDEPEPGDLVGTPPPAASLARFNPTDDLFAIEPSLSWTYEGQVQPFASIGTTPLTGEVSPLPVGELGAVYHGEGGWRASFAGVAEARRDSLLSLAGIEDPTTGEEFGRVIEVGPRIQAVVPVGGGFTVSGEALASTFIGDNIVDNDRLAAGIGLGYDLGLDGFEFFAVGPSYRYETYSENEFFFTNGHGGYFSPQSFHRVAMDMNFQTNQFEDFLLRGTASVGYEDFEEDGAFILPDNPGFGRFAASESSGIAVSGLVEGAYLISPRWQLIGFAGGATASEFTEYVAGLSLRYTFGDRDSLVTRDLFPARLGFSQR
ncbi:MAG: cellulose synthase subunit BcsC-related outer membrane protein [Pseudomonadota bacterium]